MIVTVVGSQRTERIRVNFDGAPPMELSAGADKHTPTGAEFTYRSTADGPDQCDVTVLFGKIDGHYPTVKYWHATQAHRPRPDLVTGLIRQHAPDWWGQP